MDAIGLYLVRFDRRGRVAGEKWIDEGRAIGRFDQLAHVTIPVSVATMVVLASL